MHYRPPSAKLLADSSSRMNWSANALNVALIGAAWVAADSLAGWGGSGANRRHK